MKMKKLISCLLVLILCMGMITGCGIADKPNDDSADVPQNNEQADPGAVQPADPGPQAGYVYDAERFADMHTPVVKSAVVMRGTWYDMGRQYVQQAPESAEWRIVSCVSRAAADCGGREEAMAYHQNRLSFYKEYGPELLDFFRGISDEGGYDYDDVVLAFLFAGYTSCNALSAFGEATGGDVLVGMQADLPSLSEYVNPIFMFYPEDPAYPEDVYPFYAHGIDAVNILGVAMVGTGGQNGMEGDSGDSGFASSEENWIIACRASTAQEAADMYMDVYSGETGTNSIMIDPTGDSIVIEHTAQIDMVRRPHESVEGDVDYQIINNTFFIDEMSDHLYNDGSFDDCPIRFETVKYYLDRDYGKIDLNTFLEAQSSNTYVDPDTGVMTSELDFSNSLVSYYSPESVAPVNKAAERILMDVTNMAVYCQNGNTNKLLSAIPGAASTFCRIAIMDDPMSVAYDSENYAQLYIFQAIRDMTQSGETTGERKDNLDLAKEYLIRGDRYLSSVGFVTDEEEVLSLYASAISNFSLAQAYAKLAWNNPNSIYSDYDGQYAG